MTFNKLAPLALGGVLIAGAMTSAAAAQQPQAAPAQAGAEARRGPSEWRRPDPAAMAARRADHLRAALQLRPEQEAALKAYVDAGQPKARPDRGDRKKAEAMTTPQRLDARRAMMTERLAAFDQRAASTKRFYAQLNPSQQKAFDALQQQRGGKHGMRGGRGHGPRG
jgi:protein CpxP